MMEWNVPKQLGRRSSLPGIEGKEIDLKGFVKMDGHFFSNFCDFQIHEPNFRVYGRKKSHDPYTLQN